MEALGRHKMELAWNGYGVRVKALREQVEENTGRIVKQDVMCLLGVGLMPALP